MKRWLGVLMMFFVVLLCAGFDDSCADEAPSDKVAREKQEVMTQQANAQVGMPGITNFTEKKLVADLYELRDKSIATFTYVPDYEGRLWHVCDSIGYGLPYGVQFSNPEKPINPSIAQTSTLPQAEPNGLFMPPTAEGTWVICAGAKGEPKPVYVEPRIVASPFKLHAFGEWQEGK